jgi:hypothetical protein
MIGGAVAENLHIEKFTDTNLPDVASTDMDTETDTGNGAETFNHDTGNTFEENIEQQAHVKTCLFQSENCTNC